MVLLFVVINNQRKAYLNISIFGIEISNLLKVIKVLGLFDDQ